MLSFLIYATLLASEISGIFLFSLVESMDSCSSASDFTCDNGRCVSKSKRCDGRDDCFDSSDEDDCETYLCQEPYWFRCKNEKCVSKSFICDEEDDCGDSSDEQGCKTWHIEPPEALQNCSENEWRCNDRLCIPKDWVCNGRSDCLDNSDESLHCAKNETVCTEFKCKNGNCIPNGWKCDNTNDCEDGSDEENCDLSVSPVNCSLDKGYFLCKNGSCISSSRVCDGIPNCPDRSDEVNCSISNSSCSLRNCSQSCVTTPSGSKCVCRDGYTMLPNQECTDINECQTYGICDQKCRNTVGSYQCYCDRNYVLQDDKKSCKARDGEAIIIFSCQNEIRGYFLESQLYFPIAKKLAQVIGVAFDGHYVYWTEIFSENESIVKALEDGSHKQVLLTSGLNTPEDLSIDWVTGNIYFTDAEMQHIGVCTNDGMYCTVLVNQDIQKPRSIVLNPFDGTMFWSDWGKHPEIARSNMDGTEDVSFVANEIFWPNGIALDYPNRRLYWTDAKLTTIESINLDGSNRRIISQGIAKHPFGLAVFENRVYWSDWFTRSIESCDKFTGKDHHTLVKHAHENIYDIDIYHSTLQRRLPNPCALAFCSDICLLSGKSYSCACPQNKILDTDNRTCRVTNVHQRLIIGTKDSLWILQYQVLGKLGITELPTVAQNISALAYSSVDDLLFLSDISSPEILMVNLNNGSTTHLISGSSLGRIIAMDFDDMGNNLYWCDAEKAVVEVLNLHTTSRKVLLDDMEGETPVAIVLIPKEGIMFVAFQTSKRSAHIDRIHMDGSYRTHVIEQGLLGPLRIIFDSKLHRIFWTDEGTGNIESTSTDGDDRHGFRSLQSTPIGVASLDNDIFWINRNSKRLYWATKSNSENINKRITLDLPKSAEIMHLISITPSEVPRHPCQQNNGNCSHLCLVAVGTAVCECPVGMKLQSDRKTCFKPRHCDRDEFFCQKSDICISKTMHCDNYKNCAFGEDEEDCEPQNYCLNDYFQCGNNDCIKKNLVCDSVNYDCKDRSDEENCNLVLNVTSCPKNDSACLNKLCMEHHELCHNQPKCDGETYDPSCKSVTCNAKQFRCNSGKCIPKHWECDQEVDCKDMSDEHSKCEYPACKPPKFKCSNELCIDPAMKCNKISECEDSADELSCSAKDHVTECGANEFHCYKTDSLCFPHHVRCNGSSECPHHEDEQGCSECHVDEFQCNNKKCISRQWLCDHQDDCGDESDENIHVCLHEHTTSIPHINSWCDNCFSCKNNKSVDMGLVCNGKNDCGDDSDEDGGCSTSCSSENNPCSHICVPTPVGPMCLCKPGFRLRGDGHTCTDIKECSFEPPICSQICIEKPGSFMCSCYQGYRLRSDGYTCKSVEESMSLIFVVANNIYQLSPTNNTLTMLYSGDLSNITGLDVSTSPPFVYFSTAQSKTLHRVDLNTKIREYITDVGRPQKLAVDWITQNVYFTENNLTSQAINVCNFEARYCATILNFKGASRLSALSVDALNEHLFYALSSNLHVFDAPSTIIYKSNLDGSDPEKLFKHNNYYVIGLVYNFYKQMLYYGDEQSGDVYKVHYDGTNQMKVISNLTAPSALSLFEDRLYIAIANSRITVCPLFRNYEACRSNRFYGNFEENLVVFHPSRQPAVTSPCKNQNCSYLCFPKLQTVECLCHSNAVDNEEKGCQKKQVLTVNYQGIRSEGVIGHEIKSPNVRSDRTAVVIFITGLFITLAVVGVYYYFYKKKSEHVTISMRFQNPVYGCVEDNSQDIILHPGQHEYSNPMNPYHTDIRLQKQLDTKNVF